MAAVRFRSSRVDPVPRDSLVYDAVLDQTYAYDPTHARQLLECHSAFELARASRPLRQGSIRWSVVDQPGVHEPQPATYFVRAPPVRISNVSNFSTQEYQEFISRSLAATDGEQLRSDFQSLTKILFDEAFVLVIGEADDLPCV